MTVTHEAATSTKSGAEDRRFRRRRRRSGGPLATRNPMRLFMWSAIAFLVVTTQIPFLVTIWYSLHQWNLLRPDEQSFVGFGNYIDAVQLPGFWDSLLNSVRMTGGTLLVALVGGTAVALLMSYPFAGRGVARTLVFAGFLVPPTAASLIWKTTILDGSFGLANWTIGLLGLGPVDWVARFPMSSIITIGAWQWLPFTMIIVLAGLQTEDQSAKEAARIDGATESRIFFTLTLPHLRPFLEISALLGGIFISQSLDPIMLVTLGAGNTETAPFKLYNLAFRGFDIGLASAYGVVIVILTLSVCLLLLRALISIFKESA